LLKRWPRWLEGKNGVMQSHICKELMPVLTGLGRDQEVDAVVRAVTDPADRSQCMAKAAEAYFRLGHRDLAEKFDTEAQDVAEASPTREPKLRGSHDAALHNLALVRADRGDIDGALISAAKLRDESKIRNVTRYVVQRAIAEGHGPTVGPAIETLEQRAVAAGDAGLLLEAGRDWYAIGKQKEARRSLGQAMKMFDAQQARMSWEAAGLAAELMWRLEGAGKAEAMIGIVDKLKISDPSAIDHLVEFMRPISPVVAIQLSDKQTEVWRRITGLANVAIQIAGDAK
jgi:tetratricopeptide (TPR) repeat protein